MAVDVDLSFDFSELQKILTKLGPELEKKAIDQAVRAGAKEIQKEIKKQAPYDSRRKSGTHLRDGVIVRKGRKNRRNQSGKHVVGTLSRKVPHAHLVNYGTVKLQPNRFFDRGFIASKHKAQGAMIDGVGKAVVRISRRLAK